MALFDFLTNEDPNQAAQFALAAGLLGGRGSFNEILGKSLMGGHIAGQNAAAIQRQKTLDDLQKQRFQLALDEENRKKAQYQSLENFRSSIPEPSALGGVDWTGGPTPAAAQQVKAPPPLDLLAFRGMKAGAIGPMDYINAQRKDTTPLKLAAGDVLVNPQTYKPLASAPEKQTSELQQYQFAKANNEPGTETFTGWMQAQKKAGASNTNVKIENALGSGLAGQIGPLAKEGYVNATGAVQQIQNADRLIQAIDSNKVLAGPGSTFLLKGLQIGQMMGIGGKDAAETVANTRMTIQGMAQGTLAARKALQGQGQVSNYEGELVQKAASGDIGDMTAAEIKIVANVNKRLSQQIIDQHKQFLGKIKSNKNPEVSGLADLFDVNIPKSQTIDWGDLGRKSP